MLTINGKLVIFYFQKKSNAIGNTTTSYIGKRQQMNFLNIQTILGLTFSIVGTILLMWGSHINSAKSTQQILDTQEAHTQRVLSSTDEISKLVLKLASGSDFAGALKLFNEGKLVVKKGIIEELKQKALADVGARQQVIDFLGSLNDWVTEDDESRDFFVNPELEWSKWKFNKELFEKDGTVFNKEDQILSLEASQAIDEIVYQHTKTSSMSKLHFFQKNVLAPMFVGFNFSHGSIDLTKANVFGLYMMKSINIDTTNFQSATYYGVTLFRSMQLPEKIYIGGDLGTDYKGNVCFLDIEFPRGANLTNAIFSAEVHFVTVRFKQLAHFYVSTFKGLTRFSNCDFYGEAGFNSASFQKNVFFENSRFHRKTQFVTVRFGESASFEGSSFVDTPDFKGTDTKKVTGLVIQ